MNIVQDCKNELIRLGQVVSAAFLDNNADCECGTQPDTQFGIQFDEQSGGELVQNESTCGCGQDTCQIGNGPNACKPRIQSVIQNNQGE